MKALVGAFNQEKALVGAFSVIVQLVVEPMDRFAALIPHITLLSTPSVHRGRPVYENFKPQGIEAIWWTLKLRYWYGGSGVFSHFNKAEMKIILKSINIYILDTMKERIGSDTTFKTQSIIILTEIGTTWSMHDWFHIDYSYSYSESYGISVLGLTDIIYRGGERTSCGQLDRS